MKIYSNAAVTKEDLDAVDAKQNAAIKNIQLVLGIYGAALGITIVTVLALLLK